MRRFSPEAAGSGIPHLKTVVLGERQMTWRRLLPVKFFAGVCGIGGGLALGREGPTIQMGGATGIMVSEWFQIRPERATGPDQRGRRGGAGGRVQRAAGGHDFCVGRVAREFHARRVRRRVSLLCDSGCRESFVDRRKSGIPFATLATPTVRAIPLALLLGVLCGLGGVLFNRTLLKTLDAFERMKRWPPFLLGALAGLIVGFASWMWPGIAGSGGVFVERALAGEVATHAVLALLVLRFVLTMTSYGCGAAGGIFAPLLVLGALGGLAVGRVGAPVAPVWAAQPEIFAVLGMGALLTAIVRAPLTGIVLMVELTGKYDFMLPLLASCLVAYGVAEGLRDVPIYEALRLRANGLRDSA